MLKDWRPLVTHITPDRPSGSPAAHVGLTPAYTRGQALMNRPKRHTAAILKSRPPLRVGFLPENDCAPLVVAQEFGLFSQYGLNVELESQASWKHVHDKIAHRRLDAAHAPAMMPFLMTLGLTPERCECVTGLILSLQGDGITVSHELSRLGVCNAPAMRQQMWRDRGKKVYTFGVSYPLSTQYALLCQWLRWPKVPPYIDVRIESVPPEQLFPLLKLGYLDGFCAGEPWNSVAVQAGVGTCVASSATLAPLHPEKVLLVRKDFAIRRAPEHERLIAALLHACFLCELAENRPIIRDLLAQPRFVNAPPECLQPGLVGPFGPKDAHAGEFDELNIFQRGRANQPTGAKAKWLTGRLFEFLRWSVTPPGLKEVFRPDIYRRAQQWLPKDIATEVLPRSTNPRFTEVRSQRRRAHGPMIHQRISP
jgi:ABC-type nitrate/sulfonate/bicarbonate transport system substrate-binding protein